MNDDINQVKRLEIIENMLKDKPKDKWTEPQKVCMEKLRIIREHPEYANKIITAASKNIFCTSSKDILLLVEVGRIKVK